MYPDLTARLRQDLRNLSRDELYLIRDYSIADGSFLLYHFITSYLRSPQNGRVYILGLDRTLNHYKIVTGKLGVQLQRQLDQNRCGFLDFSQLLSTSTETTSWFRFDRLLEVNSSGKNDEDDEAEESMKSLYSKIKNDIDGMMTNDSSNAPILIVIDCIAGFLDLGVPLERIVEFLRYLRTFSRKYNASFAILTNTDEEFRPATIGDDGVVGRVLSAYDRLATYLMEWGSRSFEKMIVFDVRPLASGWSQDVHGEVTIRESESLEKDDEEKDAMGKETRLLFKLGDRNVTFMAPGLIPRVGV